jgi:glycerol-3-phosphate dehydrogenase
LGGGSLEIRARAVVNATGAWADRVAAGLLGAPVPFAIRRSKGIHLVARGFLGEHALALTDGARHLFALPWRGRTLIGTTDTLYAGGPDDVAVAPDEEASLLAALRRMAPGAAAEPEHVVHRYAGVRPLIARGEAGGNTYRLSRAAEIVGHDRGGGPANFVSAIGGKWTTARLIAEQAVDRIAAVLGANLRPCDTKAARLPLAPEGRFADHEADMELRLAAVEPAVRAQLLRSYGRAAEAVVAAAGGDAALLEPVAPGVAHVMAEAVYSRRNEMAMTVEDLLCRRTSILPLGGDSEAIRETAARMLG